MACHQPLILLVSEDPDLLRVLGDLLEFKGLAVERQTLSSPPENRRYYGAIIDLTMPIERNVPFLLFLQQQCCVGRLILLSGHQTDEALVPWPASSPIILRKPYDNDHLLHCLTKNNDLYQRDGQCPIPFASLLL